MDDAGRFNKTKGERNKYEEEKYADNKVSFDFQKVCVKLVLTIAGSVYFMARCLYNRRNQDFFIGGEQMKNKLNIIVLLLITVGLLFAALNMDDPGEIWNALTSARREWLVAGFLCMVCFWALEIAVLKITSSKMGRKIPLWPATRISMVGDLFNGLTPSASGGQPVQMYIMQQYGVPVGEAGSILFVKFIVYKLVATLLAVSTVIARYDLFAAQVPGFGWIAAIGLFINIASTLMFFSVGFFPKPVTKLVDGLIWLLTKLKLTRKPEKHKAWAHKQVDEFYENFSVLKGRWHTLWAPIAITALQLSVYFLVAYAVFRALGVVTSFLDAFFAAAAVYSFSSFFPAPGASGGVEGISYLFFGLFVQDQASLLASVVLYRAVTYYIPILVCLPFYFVDKARGKIAGEGQ